MNTSATPEDTQSIQQLIADSSDSNRFFNPGVLGTSHYRMARVAATPCETLRNDIDLRTEYHQGQIYPGINHQLSHSFFNCPVFFNPGSTAYGVAPFQYYN